jgi:hypothetical protein
LVCDYNNYSFLALTKLLGKRKRLKISCLAPIFKRVANVLNFGAQEKLVQTLVASAQRYEDKVFFDLSLILILILLNFATPLTA